MTEEKSLFTTIDSMNKHLEEVVFSLKILVATAIPSSKPDAFGLTGEQKDVYELCNGTMSVDDITKEIGKPGSQVRKTLTRLRRKGLVTSVNRGKNAFYFRTNPPNTRSIDDTTDIVAGD